MNNAEAELGALDLRLTGSMLAASSRSTAMAGVPVTPKRSAPTGQGLVVKRLYCGGQGAPAAVTFLTCFAFVPGVV
jgi:hypothetical protein